MRGWKLMSAVAVTTGLVACGGGGDGTNTPTVSTGYFLDSAVGGIAYETATQAGTTGNDGSFKYVAGEDITFSVGAIKLPPVAASSQITPLDIAGTSNTEDPKVVNMLIFLQSIDSDGNPSNGIKVPAEAATNAVTALDFTMAPSAFSGQDALAALVAKIPHATLTTEADAKAHFNQTISAKGIQVAPVAIAESLMSRDQEDAEANTFGGITIGTKISLKADRSSDANGDPLSYSWRIASQPMGSTATISNASTAYASLTIAAEGSYVVELSVSDGLFTSKDTQTIVATDPQFTLTSSAFSDGQNLPLDYTCYGAGKLPELSWTNVPVGTRSIVIVMDDEDAANVQGTTYTHTMILMTDHWGVGFQSWPEQIPKVWNQEQTAAYPYWASQTNNFETDHWIAMADAPPCNAESTPHTYRWTAFALSAPWYPDLNTHAKSIFFTPISDNYNNGSFLSGVPLLNPPNGSVNTSPYVTRATFQEAMAEFILGTATLTATSKATPQ